MVPKALDAHAGAEHQPSRARSAAAACGKRVLPVPQGWLLRAAGPGANIKRMVKKYRNHRGRASGRTPPLPRQDSAGAASSPVPWKNSPSALTRHEVTHVQAGTAAAPRDVVAPAPAPQTQNVVQTMEKQLSGQRRLFSRAGQP